MIVKGILDIKIENGIMKILCEFDNNTYQVIEFSIEFMKVLELRGFLLSKK